MIVAIVPAAGLSARMGRPKPLLPINGRPLLATIVEALLAGGADAVVVVTPPADRSETAEIVRLAVSAGAIVATPDHQTVDMRSSIEFGLDRADRLGPIAAILLSPADTPGLRPELVRLVIESARRDPSAIVVPRSGSDRGHPVCLPRAVADKIRLLPAGSGVNRLLDDPSRTIVEVACLDPLGDIDTPEEYRRWIEGTRP